MAIKKGSFFYITLLILVGFAGACKKDDTQSSLSAFLTRLPWKLVLKQRFAYVNSVLVRTDIIQPSCAISQSLTFTKDNNYTYQNYACAKGTITAPWTFTSDNLYLNLNSVISVSSSNKQNVAHIINLGQYSLSFDVGDVNLLRGATDSVIIYRYGFIH